MFIKIKLWNLWKKYVLSLFKSEREPYYIGYIDMKISEFSSDEILQNTENVLLNNEYQPDYLSNEDRGQYTSMRRMYVDESGKWRQIHIRVFNDGEVRGHDELAPEEDAYAHLHGVTAREIDLNTLAKLADVMFMNVYKSKVGEFLEKIKNKREVK